ncbi:hypothetical protein POSPLADRAFT_1032852 [Postia placenta MAD-698-R-SB12]|uniref:Uncharacterized protein n=1 Tax=Postia placenta MAD-698-R-SB12 TaxID=670580 RepID=A0A1X6N7Q1_9APHY|nr:hypothetical protein POSPLADRAFT_1032852 [Postia placenta MAD-698-R-SB12]OSX64532.1 hypothetical protein POSPLADRAFT_1032852 [Postia placenta MAD-698-R-SB12]
MVADVDLKELANIINHHGRTPAYGILWRLQERSDIKIKGIPTRVRRVAEAHRAKCVWLCDNKRNPLALVDLRWSPDLGDSGVVPGTWSLRWYGRSYVSTVSAPARRDPALLRLRPSGPADTTSPADTTTPILDNGWVHRLELSD